MATLHLGSENLATDGVNGRVGIGTTTPGANLDVAGNIMISDGSGNKSIIVALPPTGNSISDKRNIQDVIDAVSASYGGTVILQKGQYKIKGITGTHTSASASDTVLTDSSGNFISDDVKVNDTIINLTRHCAGKITARTATTITVAKNNIYQNVGTLNAASSGATILTGAGTYFTKDYKNGDTISIAGQNYTVSGTPSSDTQITISPGLTAAIIDGTAHSAYYGLIGNLTKSNNKFDNGDKYCISGLTMRSGVRLIGQGRSSTSLVGSSSKAFTIITVDPNANAPVVEISHLGVTREGTWDMSDQNDVAIDIYNHFLYGPWTGCPPICRMDSVLVSYIDTSVKAFTTGVRIASWGGMLTNVFVNRCATGILLEFPDDYANNINLQDCGTTGPSGLDSIGMKMKGGNNRVIGGNFNTGLASGDSTHSVSCIQVGETGFPGVIENCILGPYIEGYGSNSKGINLDSSSKSTLITGCYFDLPSGAPCVSYNSSTQNNVWGNYDKSTGNGDWIVGGSVGIGTANPTSKLTVGSIGINSSGNIYQFGYGYVKTDTSLYRAGTLAQSSDSYQPFALYAAVKGASADANRVACLQTGNEGQNNLGNIALQAYGGNVGVGTPSPSEKLTVTDTQTISIGDGKGNGGVAEIQIKNPAALLLGLDSKTNGNEFLRFATEQRRNWIQSFEATAGNPQSAALTLAAGTTRAIEIDNAGNVGVGNVTALKSKLDVSGSVGVKVTTVTGNYTAADEIVILVNTGTATITLPLASSCPGRTYYIKKISPSVAL